MLPCLWPVEWASLLGEMSKRASKSVHESWSDRLSVVSRIPAPVRKWLASALPSSWVEGYRQATMRRYNLPSVVVRESRLKRFVKRDILRLYYPPSMVSRRGKLGRWVDSRVLRRKPRLFHFEVHITDHCNLNCKGCGHFSNLAKASFLDLEEFRSEMAQMARLFDVEQIFLLGGEPLLHPQVNDFVRIARELFGNTRLYLMTNGLLVTRMDDEFWATLRDTNTILLCDQYPIDLPIQTINELGAKHGVVIEWTDPRGEFFKIPIDAKATQDPADSFSRCSGVNNCPMLRDGRLYPCAYIAYSHVLANKFDVSGLETTEADSVAIDDSTDADEVMRFLTRPVPWCAHCDFDQFCMFDWTRSQRQLDEWTG